MLFRAGHSDLARYLDRSVVHRADLCPVEWLDDLAGASELEEELIRHLSRSVAYGKVGNKIMHRQTFPGRFSHLDSIVADLAVARFDPGRLLRVHDTAAANAIASVELYDLLRSRFRVDFIASDLHTELLFVDAGNTGWRVAMLPDGEWCQARRGKLVVNRYTWKKWRRVLNTLLGRYVETVVIPRAQKAFREGRIARRITLFHPKARRLAASHGDFHLEAADITNLPRGRFDIVRAMIVGLPGWDQPLRSRALQSLCGSLREGGLLVIGAADFSASVFVRSGGRMKHLRGDGADTPLRPEIEALQIPFGDVSAGAAEEATI